MPRLAHQPDWLAREHQRRRARGWEAVRPRARRAAPEIVTLPYTGYARQVFSDADLVQRARVPRVAAQTLREVAAAERRARARCQPRDGRGRFLPRSAALWWRPRDERGRFLPLDHDRRHYVECARDLLAQEERTRLAAAESQRQWARAGIYLNFDLTTGSQNIVSAGQVFPFQATTGGSATFWQAGQYLGTGTVDWTPNWSQQQQLPYTTQLLYGTQPTYYANARPPQLAAHCKISARELHNHPDPDALLGDRYKDLERFLRQKIEEYMDTDGTWRGWTAQMIDVSYSGDAQTLRATATPTTTDPTAEVWNGWQQAAQPLTGPVSRSIPRKSAAELERERWDRRQRDIIYANQSRARRMRSAIATRKAEELLRSILTAEQNRSLTDHQGFDAIGSEGGHYWISVGHSGNVYSLDEHRRRRESLCIHNYGHELPDYDQMVAQLLLLTHDELEFRRVANISPRHDNRPMPLVEAA